MIFLNGQWIEESKASVSVLDRGFLFGDGIFDTMRLAEGKLEFFSSHLQRLSFQAAELGISFPEIHPEWFQQLVTKNQAQVGVWRVKTLLTREALFLLMIHPDKTDKSPRCLVGFPTPFSSPTANWKSLSYLDRLTFCRYAEAKGVEDVVLYDSAGQILETSKANLFWVKENTFYTPSKKLNLLFGVTLSGLIGSVKNEGMDVCEVTAKEIPIDAHVYTINAMQHIQPVIKIDKTYYQCSKQIEQFLGNSLQKAILTDHLSLLDSPEQRYKALSSLAQASSRERLVTSNGNPK